MYYFSISLFCFISAFHNIKKEQRFKFVRIPKSRLFPCTELKITLWNWNQMHQNPLGSCSFCTKTNLCARIIWVMSLILHSYYICARLPESPVLGCSPSRYNLCDEYRRVISNVWVISPTSNTESQTRVTLQTHTISVLMGKISLLILRDNFILSCNTRVISYML